ncbi:MAG: double-transrane region domain protein [Gemmatimonadetes bacterium]|nr:double-transrane region domain protein [Gemmatimonadota bacterium]
MGFLAPLWLLAGAAAAVPLLIHLMRRRAGARIEFPAVRYLVRAEREHSRDLRLRNLLLMILRVAAVLLITLAAAHPIIRMAGAGHAPSALAVVLDNSLSTSAVVGGRPVLQQLQSRAREILRRASASDRVWLITADGVVHGGSRDAVLDAAAHAEPFGGAGDLRAATARAAQLARASALPAKEIVVLTDGQATSWGDPLSLGDIPVHAYVPAATAPANHAVVAVHAIPARWTPRGAVRARLLASDSATYRITLEGRSLARGIAARDEEIVLRAEPPERGWSSGTVELEPDELRADDVRHFAVWIGAAPAVSIHPLAGPFARSALDALVQSGRASVGNEIALAPADEATKLPALLVAPSDPIKLGAANRALERLGVPWRFGAAQRGESVVRASDSTRALDGVTVGLRYALSRASGAERADTIAMAGGAPWIVAGPRYVLVASPLAPPATTFPLHASFVPWLDDMLSQRLSGEGGIPREVSPGQHIARPRGADALELPEGGETTLSGDSLAAPARAGTYFYLRGTTRVGALVVNAEPAESELARLAPQALAVKLGTRSANVLTDTTALSARVLTAAPQRPLIAPLLLIAALTLLIETLITTPARRRAA